MALTVNTVPAAISNSASFDCTTSLVEDSTHVNLRVRADIYHEGIVKAIVEKPKGISGFDFSDILKSLIPGLLFARDSGDYLKIGTIGANLITSWTGRSGSWTTFGSTANVINSAICTVVSTLETNAISMNVGDLFLFYSPNFGSTGYYPKVYLETGGPDATVIDTNKSFILMCTVAGSIKIVLGDQPSQNFSGDFYLHKITTNRTTIGNPIAPYMVVFSEIYEDASGVTQTGSSGTSKLYRFVPAKGDGIAFSEYVLHDSTSLFANKTYKNNVTKWYSHILYEHFISIFTEYVSCKMIFTRDGVPSGTAFICSEGWGAIILNVGEIMATVAQYLDILITDVNNVPISETIRIYVDSSKIDERVILEFDGLVGGKEYLAFEGLKDEQFTTARNYRTGKNKNRLPISFVGICRQKLETRFKDINNAEYLKSLLISDNVKRLEPSYAIPKDVTIITDTVKILGSDLFTNQIDIEYEY